jgi:pyruvate/2-oxoglutarate/acetoin dehydrogenase E1 component
VSYKDELTAAMTSLGQDPLVRFIGYGIKYGKAMGTLKGVPESSLVETPVAENLMVGAAIGMALKGLKPVVYFERFDFVLNAADAIVNHLDKIKTISDGEFNPTMILRIVVGNKQKPLFTGPTHVQDISEGLQAMVSFPVIPLMEPCFIKTAYQVAYGFLSRHSAALIEYRDLI